jgi:hypothetical protein
MQASIKTRQDGSVAVQLDSDAAQAAFASIVFASRFHENIAPLARIVEERLKTNNQRRKPVRTTCR